MRRARARARAGLEFTPDITFDFSCQGSLRRRPRVPGKRHWENLHGQDRPLQPGEQTGSPEGVRDPESPSQRQDHGAARSLRDSALPGAGSRVLHRQRAASQPHRQVGATFLPPSIGARLRLLLPIARVKRAFVPERFRYSEDDVVAYLVQILQGVEYLHSRRILHLDLKPDNILVTNLNAIKIVDFGSAQSFNPLSLKQKDSRTGSLEYMGEDGSSVSGSSCFLC